MQDSQSHFYNQYQNNLSDWSVDLWLSRYSWIGKLGFRSHDLEHHPRIDDCMSLLRLRIELWNQMNTSEQAVWGAYWGLVYRKHRQLKDKAWKKFEAIAKNIDNRQQKIQLIRTATQQYQNKNHDMTAKGFDLSQSKLVKGNQQGGREEHTLLPWE
jgi:hypothetical protein